MLTETEVTGALRGVIDPEIGLSVVDLGLIYSIETSESGVRVTMTATTPSCPMGQHLVNEVEAAVRRCAGAPPDVTVDLVWEPPWSPARMAPGARAQLGWEA